jgi:diguanylate cyclase
MRYVENPEKASAIGGQALERMAELGMPANPLNYELWYSYFSGAAHDLNLAVDELLSKGGSVDEMRLAEIHREFLAVEDDGERVEQISGELEQQIDQVLSHMRETSDDNKGFGASLADYSVALAEGAAEGDVGAVVRNILMETQNVVARSKALERKLQESGEQIGTLQQSLQGNASMAACRKRPNGRARTDRLCASC